MKTTIISAVIGISLFCSGCVVSPVPMLSHRAPDEKTIALIKEGVTTKEEVLMMLGEPDWVADDERYFQYRWDEIYGFVGGWFGSLIGHAHCLNITFDDNNVVKNCELTKRFKSL